MRPTTTKAPPAAVLVAKIMMPATKEPGSRTTATEDKAVTEDQFLEYRNVIDAAASGAADGLRLALNVGAMLIAFISLLALLNLILGSIAASSDSATSHCS